MRQCTKKFESKPKTRTEKKVEAEAERKEIQYTLKHRNDQTMFHLCLLLMLSLLPHVKPSGANTALTPVDESDLGKWTCQCEGKEETWETTEQTCAEEAEKRKCTAFFVGGTDRAASGSERRSVVGAIVGVVCAAGLLLLQIYFF